MKTATVREVKEHLGDVLRSVEAGDEVEILKGKRPVARIVPVGPRSRKVDWSDLPARLRRIYGGRVVSGKPTHQIVAESRGEY